VKKKNGSFSGFATKKVMVVMPLPSSMVVVLPSPSLFYSFSFSLVLLV